MNYSEINKLASEICVDLSNHGMAYQHGRQGIIERAIDKHFNGNTMVTSGPAIFGSNINPPSPTQTGQPPLLTKTVYKVLNIGDQIIMLKDNVNRSGFNKGSVLEILVVNHILQGYEIRHSNGIMIGMSEIGTGFDEYAPASPWQTLTLAPGQITNTKFYYSGMGIDPGSLSGVQSLTMTKCNHIWKEYTGLNYKEQYCTKCPETKDRKGIYD